MGREEDVGVSVVEVELGGSDGGCCSSGGGGGDGVEMMWLKC